MSAVGPWWGLLLLVGAAVLLASGGLKLADRDAFARAVDGFDVLPTGVGRLAKQALPVVEVGLGVLLLLTSGAVWRVAAWAVAALLLVFTGLVGVTLARGERPSCRCFGAISAERISGWTLVRNVGLSAFAVLLAWGPGRPSTSSGGVVVLWRGLPGEARSQLVALVLFTAAVVVLWIRQDRLRVAAGPAATTIGSSGAAPATQDPAQPESLALAPIPPLRLTSPQGVEVSLRELAAEKAQLLVYVSPTCATCHQLTPLVADWQELLGDEIGVRLVSIGSPESTAEVYPHQLDQIWFDTDQAYGELGVPGTPTAVLLGNNGTIGAGPAAGTGAIQELLGTIVQALGVNLMTGASQQGRSANGEATREDQASWLPAPGTALGQLTVVMDDGTVASYPDALATLAAAAGVDTLTTLAWRHDCGYCEEIVEDVRRVSSSGSVVLVVSEDPATVRAQGLDGPVLQVLSPATAIEAVGVPGTPAAVPVRDGVVAGLGGIGGPHVLEVIADNAGAGLREVSARD